jgi:phage terminase large subunit GpA-like protein
MTAAADPMPAALPAIEYGASERMARSLAVKRLRAHLRLPPKLTLAEWADRYRVISPPAAEAGPWRTDRVPYMREPMDTVSGREYQDITLVKCSQSSGTEGLINNPVGYFIDQEPSSLLVIQPNVKPMAEGWSKERLAPMLRDTPRLRHKVRDPRSRDSGNTVLQKSFPGGFLVVIGANSPAGLASWPIRVVLGDELDRWPASAGTEGDPLGLAEARQTTYRHRKKTVKVSTPGNAGESRIEREWEASDQRHYYVPCPHCGEEQPLEWRDSNGSPDIRAGRGAYRLVWEKDGEGERTIHKPETAAYQCRKCERLIAETHKPAMLARGRWVKHNPKSDRAGFFISGLLSPWVRWRDIAAKWLRAKDDTEQRKTFFNTVLGLLYETEGEQPDSGELISRCTDLPTGPAGEVRVPSWVGAVTVAIDVQGDRLECDTRGWGEAEETVLLRHEKLLGDPTEADVWNMAQAVIDKVWRHESGAPMRVDAVMVDSGDETDTVYRWVRPRQARRVYAYKGAANAKEPMSRASKANKEGVKTFTVNPNKFKDTLFGRLKRRRPGPGYLHFGLPEQTGADEAYFNQYGAEKRVVEFVKNIPQVKYVRLASRRNEAIDLYVMNLAALRSLGRTFVERLGTRAAAFAAYVAHGDDTPPDAPSPPAASSDPTPAPTPAPRRTGYMSWRPSR